MIKGIAFSILLLSACDVELTVPVLTPEPVGQCELDVAEFCRAEGYLDYLYAPKRGWLVCASPSGAVRELVSFPGITAALPCVPWATIGGAQ